MTCLYSHDTKVLTLNGWKYFKDLSTNDCVAHVLNDNSYIFARPLLYIEERYKGNMINFFDYYGKIDLLVTPDSKILFIKNDKHMYQDADVCKFYYNKNIMKSAKAKSSNRRLSNMERLHIAFQADGAYGFAGNYIMFNLQKNRKIIRLISILNDIGLPYKVYKMGDGRTAINIKSIAHLMYKNFSWVDVQDMNYEWCQEFIEEMSYWDSYRAHDNRFVFASTNKDVVDIVEIITISAGYSCYISTYIDNRSDKFSDVYRVNILKNNLLGGQSINKNIILYDGVGYNIGTISGKTIIKRNNGQIICATIGGSYE